VHIITIETQSLGDRGYLVHDGTAVLVIPMVSYPVVGWSDLVHGPAATKLDVLLDTHRDDEWAAGHIAGAVHIPLHELPDRLDEVPSGRVWVHCGTGYRASTAASILHRAGRDVRHINQEYAAAGSSGLNTVG
jgi:hydroxyacylglutathione hydrolase